MIYIYIYIFFTKDRCILKLQNKVYNGPSPPNLIPNKGTEPKERKKEKVYKGPPKDQVAHA